MSEFKTHEQTEALLIIEKTRKLKIKLEKELKNYKKKNNGVYKFNKEDYIEHIEQVIYEMSETIKRMQKII